MFSWIRDWLDARRRDRVQEQYQRGYMYAAAQLVQGTPVDAVEVEIDDLSHFFDKDAFDHGAVAACRSWRKTFGAAR